MQTKPLYRLIFTTGAALAAAFLILATPNARAGLFQMSSEPADWNGPFVAFDNGGVWSNFDWSFDGTTIDLTRQFNLATASPNPNGGAGIPNNATTPNFTGGGMPGHSSDDSAYFAGIDLGYNKQMGHFVIGGSFGFTGTRVQDESDFRATETGTITVNPSLPGASPSPTDVFFSSGFRSHRKIEQEWAGYTGGQLGFAWNRFFIYAIGGAAFAQIDVHSFDAVTTEFSMSPTPTPIGVVGVPPPQGVPLQCTQASGGTAPCPPNTQKKVLQNNTVQVGWFAGAGLQYAFTDTVSAGLEYRHNDYGDTEYHIGVGEKGTSALFPAATTISNDNNQVLFKVSIQLGNLGAKHTAAAATGMSKK